MSRRIREDPLPFPRKTIRAQKCTPVRAETSAGRCSTNWEVISPLCTVLLRRACSCDERMPSIITQGKLPELKEDLQNRRESRAYGRGAGARASRRGYQL